MWKIDLAGKRFGTWTVLGDSGERAKSGSVMWECVCDCGTQRNVKGSSLRRGDSNNCGCSRRRDITGESFGQLTALKSTEKDSLGNALWECSCECGNLHTLPYSALVSGRIKSCGCLNVRDLTGQRFGKLTAIRSTEKRINGNIVWECVCDCATRTEVTTTSLTIGHTKSCGCARTLKGEEHHSYNPNLTNEERVKNRYRMSDGDFRTWANLIKCRDNHTCQICKQHGGNLNAHHLNSWNAFPEQRFDLDNGATLCEDCHKKFHKTYGQGDNTRDQFNEFAILIIGLDGWVEVGM